MKNHRSRISRMVAIALTAVMMVTGIDMPVYAVETGIKAGLAASEIFSEVRRIWGIHLR